jgi:tRNA (uracil-5-)-methyltransferase
MNGSLSFFLAMVILQVNPRELSEEEFSELKEYIITSLKLHQTTIHTLLLQSYSGKAVDFPSLPCDILWGEGYVHEQLFSWRFRISPTSFFQTNTAATEVLYSVIQRELLLGATPQDPPILLDLCCGIGTIGMALSSSFKEVIGVEMSQEAVIDAVTNSNINQLHHVRYLCAKVEDIIHDLLRRYQNQSLVAILDPPRQGVRKESRDIP